MVVHELPVVRHSMCDTWELRYMLAICAFHEDETELAKAALENVVQYASTTDLQDDEHRLQICDIGHHLAQIYISLGNLELARTTCDSALHGRRRLLGKTHESACESVALMMRIFQCRGNTARADALSTMIPKKYWETFSHLMPKEGQQDSRFLELSDLAQSHDKTSGNVVLPNDVSQVTLPAVGRSENLHAGQPPNYAIDPASDHPIAETGAEPHVKQLNGHSRMVGIIRFSADGLLLASSSSDKSIRVWDLATGKEKMRYGLDMQHEPVLMEFSSDARKLALAQNSDSQGLLTLVDVSDGERLWQPKRFLTISALAFSPRGDVMAVAGGDYVELYDVSTGRKQDSCRRSHTVLLSGYVDALAFSPRGTMLAVKWHDERTRVWRRLKSDSPGDSGRIKLLDQVKLGGVMADQPNVCSMVFSTDEKFLGLCTTFGRVETWDLFKTAVSNRVRLRDFQACYTSSAFLPDGRLLIHWEYRRELRDAPSGIWLWNPATGRQIKILDLQTHADRSPTTLAISLERGLIACGYADGSIRLRTLEIPVESPVEPA